MITHLQAKEIVDPLVKSAARSLFARAVAWTETKYGGAWKAGAGQGSNNMGAITTSTPDALSFEHVDSRPGPSGPVSYTTWFRGYATPELGFADLVAELYARRPSVARAVDAGEIADAVTAMYDTGYFSGTSTSKAADIDDYLTPVESAIATIRVATGEAPIVPLAEVVSRG